MFEDINDSKLQKYVQYQTYSNEGNLSVEILSERHHADILSTYDIGNESQLFAKRKVEYYATLKKDG